MEEIQNDIFPKKGTLQRSLIKERWEQYEEQGESMRKEARKKEQVYKKKRYNNIYY